MEGWGLTAESTAISFDVRERRDSNFHHSAVLDAKGLEQSKPFLPFGITSAILVASSLSMNMSETCLTARLVAC